MTQEWVSVDTACDRLAISKSTLYRRIKQGNIQSKKDENGKTLCIINVSDDTEMIQDDTTGTMQILRQAIETRDQEIAELKERLLKKDELLEDNRKRQDTIVLQLTRQLDNQQKLLEYKRQPFWKRWFRGKEDR